MEKYYSTEEIGEILSVQPRAVTRWIRDGLLSAIKIGRDYRVSESSLEQFIKERETPAKRKEG